MCGKLCAIREVGKGAGRACTLSRTVTDKHVMLAGRYCKTAVICLHLWQARNVSLVHARGRKKSDLVNAEKANSLD
eukprot:scaffold30057_cov20-Tisochrysis_lutea.AAC.6